MPHSVEILDGTTTLALSSPPYSLMSYPIKSAEVVLQGGNQNNQEEDISGVVYSDVREQLTVFISEASPAAAQTALHAIENFFPKAHRRQVTDTGPRIYIKLQLISDTTVWRSEIVSGKVTPAADAFTTVPQSKMQVVIEIVRRYFWEAPPVALTLNNRNGASTTLTIYNHNDSDAGHDNFGQVAAADLDGTIPGPVKVSIINDDGGNVTYKNIHIGINTFADPVNFQHIFEGENCSGNGSTQNDSTCSGGKRSDITVGPGYGVAYYWLPSTTFFAAAAGQRFRMIARFKGGLNTGLYVKPVIGTYSSPLFFPTWNGDEIQGNGSRLVDMGTVQLPKTNYVPNTNYSAGFGIGWRAASSNLMMLDYVMLIPSDGYKKLEQISSLLPGQGDAVVDDNRYDEAYIYDTAGFKYNVFESMGTPLYLWPNRLQKVYTVFDEGTENTISRKMKLSVTYFPRRLTL